MNLIEWNHQLHIGIASIDIQHKQLVAYMNDLHDAMTNGNHAETINTILTHLIEYTVHHFDYEERLFEKHGYPQSEAHKAEHATLCTSILEFKETCEHGEVTLSAEIMDFLKGWLINHILHTDKQYVTFLVNKGVG